MKLKRSGAFFDRELSENLAGLHGDPEVNLRCFGRAEAFRSSGASADVRNELLICRQSDLESEMRFFLDPRGRREAFSRRIPRNCLGGLMDG